MTGKGLYQLEIEGNRLIFRTSSFTSERGSILHSGIYNRELASVLAASLISGGVFVFLSFSAGNKLLLYLLPLFIFIVTFLFFRTMVLREPQLSAMFDKGSGQVSIAIRKPFSLVKSSFPITSMSDVILNHNEFEPMNPDGIAVVEKIALQHGTVIPGFGEKEEFYDVELSFGPEKSIRIFSSREREVALEILNKIKAFLGRNNGRNL